MATEQIYFTMSLLEATLLLIVCFFFLFVHNTLRVMAKNTQLIYKSHNNIINYKAQVILYQCNGHNGYNKCKNCSIIRFDPTTAKHNSAAKDSSYLSTHALTNDLSHNVYGLFQLKLQLLE